MPPVDELPAMPRGGPHARRRALALAATGVLLLLAVAPAGAAAEEPPEEAACPVVASAQGVQLTASKSDDLFLSAPFGAGAPAAQSCVDYGVRDSSGFAAAPYPGETVISLPGLLRSQTGQPLPDYPAYAASRHPSAEKSEVSEEGYSLSSRSTETSTESKAKVSAGPDSGSSASARSVVDPQAKTAEATAASDTQPLKINDVLELGQVRSTATAKMAPGGKLVRASQLRVGRTTVAGQEVEITPDGVQAAGETIGLPADDPAEALEAAGLRVRYLTAEKTGRGVLSAGLEVLARQQDPAIGTVYDVRYVFGRAFAAAAEVEEGPGGVGGDAPLGDVEVAAPEGGPVDAGKPATGEVPSGPAPAEEAPEPAEAPEAAEVPDAQAAPAQARLAANPVEMGVAGLYLVLVFGALAMVAGGTLLRLLGVKTRWTS